MERHVALKAGTARQACAWTPASSAPRSRACGASATAVQVRPAPTSLCLRAPNVGLVLPVRPQGNALPHHLSPLRPRQQTSRKLTSTRPLLQALSLHPSRRVLMTLSQATPPLITPMEMGQVPVYPQGMQGTRCNVPQILGL